MQLQRNRKCSEKARKQKPLGKSSETIGSRKSSEAQNQIKLLNWLIREGADFDVFEISMEQKTFKGGLVCKYVNAVVVVVDWNSHLIQ